MFRDSNQLHLLGLTLGPFLTGRAQGMARQPLTEAVCRAVVHGRPVTIPFCLHYHLEMICNLPCSLDPPTLKSPYFRPTWNILLTFRPALCPYSMFRTHMDAIVHKHKKLAGCCFYLTSGPTSPHFLSLWATIRTMHKKTSTGQTHP